MRRTLPFSPTSTAQLELGDIVPVQKTSGRWGALQVTDLMESGPGSRTTLVVGVLDWEGASPPQAEELSGIAVTEQALTRVELFTEGGLQVTGNVQPQGTELDSPFRDHGVGARTRVWGWRTAVRRVSESSK